MQVTLEQIAQVPQEHRRYGWVAVHMVRSSGRGRRTWEPLCVIGFFPEQADALAYAKTRTQSAGYKIGVCPFEDGNPIGLGVLHKEAR